MVLHDFFMMFFFAPGEVITVQNVGQQIFIADQSNQCPESSTGQSILFPDEGHLPGDNSASTTTVVTAVWSVTLLAIIAILTF